MNFRAEAFKTFSKSLSSELFVPLLPVLMSPLEKLAGAKDFELTELLDAESSDAWFWRYKAAQFLGEHVQALEGDQALAALCRLAADPQPMVVEGAARGLATASLRLGPRGHELLERLTELSSPPLIRCAAAHSLGVVIQARWPQEADALKDLLRRVALDPDGRVRRGAGQYLVGRFLFLADAAAARQLAADWLSDPENNLRAAAKDAQNAMEMQ